MNEKFAKTQSGVEKTLIRYNIDNTEKKGIFVNNDQYKYMSSCDIIEMIPDSHGCMCGVFDATVIGMSKGG